LLGRDVSQLSNDQLGISYPSWSGVFATRVLPAPQAATIILDGVKANRWRILVGADANKIDEMVRQPPDRAYDIAFFDEFARAAGWTQRLLLENPDLRAPS
jgi:hypothetical protein